MCMALFTAPKMTHLMLGHFVLCYGSSYSLPRVFPCSHCTPTEMPIHAINMATSFELQRYAWPSLDINSVRCTLSCRKCTQGKQLRFLRVWCMYLLPKSFFVASDPHRARGLLIRPTRFLPATTNNIDAFNAYTKSFVGCRHDQQDTQKDDSKIVWPCKQRLRGACFLVFRWVYLMSKSVAFYQAFIKQGRQL